MAYGQHYRSPFGDTTFTKVFVGGLAWETPVGEMQTYFQQFGHILEAVIIADKISGKSKGYGFVTFKDGESAKRACNDPNPVIDGRRANCNIASLGRPRPSPPRGRNQGGIAFQWSNTIVQGVSQSYSGAAPPLAPPPPPPPVIYPPYGYAMHPREYAYHQGIYNPAMQHPYHHQVQVYGPTSPTVSTAYYYGYSPTQVPAPRGAFGAGALTPQAQRIHQTSYLYYPTQQMGPSTFSDHPTPAPPLLVLPSRRQPFPPPSPTGLQTPQNDTKETDDVAVSPGTPNS